MSSQGPCGSNFCVIMPWRTWPQGRWLAEVYCLGALQQAACVRYGSAVKKRACVCLLGSYLHDGYLVSSALISPHRRREVWKRLKLAATWQRQRYYMRVCFCAVLIFDHLEQERLHLTSERACAEVNTCNTGGNWAADLCSRDSLFLRWLLWSF